MEIDIAEFYEKCRLCPRNCLINRTNGIKKNGHPGFCGETDQLKVSYVGPHFGEEPPITGKMGSGAVFFTGCSLRCSYCQNYQISHQRLGTNIKIEELISKLEYMINVQHVHNINFVTPDHFFPHVFCLVALLRKLGHDLPVVYNLSGYQSVEMIKIAERYSDIYLPDFKYSDASLAGELSGCTDYPQIALDAICEMVRQKGFLDFFPNGTGLAEKGVLVRHMILPGKIENSINALTSLFLEFGKELPLSLMSQYHPVFPLKRNQGNLQKDPNMNRFITKEEFDKVYSHANDLGFIHLYVQFPDKNRTDQPANPLFLPDFRQPDPFR